MGCQSLVVLEFWIARQEWSGVLDGRQRRLAMDAQRSWQIVPRFGISKNKQLRATGITWICSGAPLPFWVISANLAKVAFRMPPFQMAASVISEE